MINSKIMKKKRMGCFTLRVRSDGLLRADAIVMTVFLSSFVLIQKKQKIKAKPSRRPAKGWLANRIMSRYARRYSVLTPSSPSGYPACEVYAIYCLLIGLCLGMISD
jgi:hypothetical protein